MINFTALETEKTKIKQMSLKELIEYGEKLYRQIKACKEKEQSKDYVWFEPESDCVFFDTVSLIEILNAVFAKKYNNRKNELNHFTIESLLNKSKDFSDLLELLHQSFSNTK